MVKNPPAYAGDIRDGLETWDGKMCWRRKWQPTPVFLPGESHGQRNLAGYSSQRCKESDLFGSNLAARRDFPNCPVVKTRPSNAEGVGSIPSQGTKVSHAMECG